TMRLAARNLLRRKLRTGLTAGMVTMGVALLMLALTWVGGAMGGAMATATAAGGHVRIVDPDFAAREELMPLEENLPETAPLVALLRSQPGVRAVEPRITAGVTVSAGEEIGEVFALAVGAEPSYFEAQLRANEKLVQGGWFSGGADELVLGRKVAAQAKAKPGDEVLLLGMTQDGSLSPIKGRVVGVVGGSGLEQQVLVPLEKLRWLTDISEGATELLVYGDDYRDAPSLARGLRNLPGLKPYAVDAWSEREPWRSLGATVKGMQGIIVFVVVFLAALGIWNTMTMSVLERTHEIGVLRALGLSRPGAVAMFVGEGAVIGVLGGLAGLLLGLGPAWLLEHHGIHIGAKVASSSEIPLGETVYGDLTLSVMGWSFALGLLMAILGSVLPALRAASIQPVSAMRSGR
ncbi:MAG: ABC transporter permease, partial [Myxococcales bacterium]